MTGTVWGKFYWSDWASDPALRLCSFAAQGLWMRLLCIAAEADPIGHVTVNGKTLDSSDIARLVGGSEQEVSILIGELEGNGVFSRDRNGRIYSRRMVRDARRAADARKNGKKGGNPSLCREREIPIADNPPLIHSLITQKPETREEKMDLRVSKETLRSCPKPGKRAPYPPDFEEFWKAYPTDGNMSKADAFAVWKRLSADDREAAIASIPGFVRFCERDKTYRPVHAVRYLRSRRFEGHLAEAKRVAAQCYVSPGTPQWAAWLAYKREQGSSTVFMEQQGRAEGKFLVPSEWPPGKERAA